MECEVVVVGGGPAGSTAARLLAEKRIDTILIEKNLSFNKPCGGGIPSAGLKEFDILYKLQTNIPFNRITRIKIVPPFSDPLEVDFHDGELLIFNRSKFDSCLRKLAEEKGAKLIEAELISIEYFRSKIKSNIKTKSGDIIQVISKYIIAADGVNSKICSLTGIPRPLYYWTVSFHAPEKLINKKDICEFWFGSSHASFFYSWIFPGTDYLSIGTGSEDIKKLENLITNFIERRFNKQIDVNSYKLRAYKIPIWEDRKFFKNNILFCGDALGTVMPVSFEGIYYSMKSAQFASEAIIQKDLNLYERLWDERFLKQFSMMKKFQDIMFGSHEAIDKWLNIHRDPAVQEFAMALWLRKEHGSKLIPLYLKAFKSFISRIVIF